MAHLQHIELRGVAVHNLQRIDLDLPRGQLVVICGVSGSGKSSLAFDTLYAEGQRRYIESLSPYTRQFLERLEKPAAERIEGIPPAIAVAQGGANRSSRATVGTFTEITDYLRLLFAKIGQIVCPGCRQEVRRDWPQDVAQALASLPEGARIMIAFDASASPGAEVAAWREEGFVRAVVGERVINLADEPWPDATAQHVWVVVDRVTAGATNLPRLRESVEQAMARGAGRCQVLVPEAAATAAAWNGQPHTLAGEPWRRRAFSNQLRCEDCSRDFALPEPHLFSFNSPLGACPACEGFGNTMDVDLDRVVPDRHKSLREGAIAPWNTPAYAHELEELVALASDVGLPLDIPFAELSE